MFKKYFVEEVIKRVEHPNDIKRWKAIENAIYMLSSKCDNRCCSNVVNYLENDKTILYVTDSNGTILDVSPYHVSECEICGDDAFFCDDKCMYGDEDYCYKCTPKCIFCNKMSDANNTFVCAYCSDIVMCTKHVTKCESCDEVVCSKCMKKNICDDCSNS